MIRILYAFKNNCPLELFLKRQISEANLEGYSLSLFSIDLNPMLVDHYGLTKWHTVIFKDSSDNELHRIEGPFDSKELEEALQISKGILSNRLKGGDSLCCMY